MKRLFLCAVLLAGCSDESPLVPDGPTPTLPDSPTPRFDATVRRTQFGVAHVTAKDWGSLGFGQGRAIAEDQLCTLQYIRLSVRSELARFLGPGQDNANLLSDVGYQALGLRDRAQAFLAHQSADMTALVEGYAAGYNAYLATHPDTTCSDKAFVAPLDAVDVAAQVLVVSTLTSSGQLVKAIAAAAPPAATQGSPSVRYVAPLGASNGWAFGADRTESGNAILVGNPHFPFEGPLKFHEIHLTLPGQLDVYGAAIMGVPGVFLAASSKLAYTMTVSPGARGTVYALKLVPGNPTRYEYDGETLDLEQRTHSIQVLGPDGTTQTVTRTTYRSRFGPVFSLALPVPPGIPQPAVWNATTALSFKDAIIDNDHLLEQLVLASRAQSVDELRTTVESVHGVSSVNFVAADSAGNVFFTDASQTPDLSPQAIQTWGAQAAAPTSLAHALLPLGMIVLDGSTSVNEWSKTLDGTLAPRLKSRDFVFNANNVPWLATDPAAAQPTLASPLQGLARTPLSLRSRMNLRLLLDRTPTGPFGADGKMSFSEAEAAILNDRSITSELLKDAVVERCNAAATAIADKLPAGFANACNVLAQWDGKFELDSTGAIVWRQIGGYFSARNAQSDKGLLFADAFDASDPVGTPRGLAPLASLADGTPDFEKDPMVAAIAGAVTTLGRTVVPLDAKLGKFNFVLVGDEKIAMHGGFNIDGATQIAEYRILPFDPNAAPRSPRDPEVDPTTGLTTGGYFLNYGSSFIFVVELTPDGPRIDALLTYGESEDPRSPHHADQMRLFSAKTWRKGLFKDADIKADMTLTEEQVRGD